MTGQTISHYQVLEKLGEGGMGVVYKARDIHLGRLVAVKVLSPLAGQKPERKLRFLQEARAASALNHPNIITIYEIASLDDSEYIIMELIAGATLHDFIDRGRLAIVDALKYSVQIADALTAAHTAGIIHRDLKPANVMITPNGLVKVLDFGLAKLAESANDFAREQMEKTQSMRMTVVPQTQEGAIVGTVSYMAPEQAGGRKVDARADIFAFGALLYEMLSGEKAFQGESGISTLAAVLRDEPRPLSELAEDTPLELQAIVERCLRKSPDERFQKMEEVKAALEEIYYAIRSGTAPTSSGIWKRPLTAKAMPSIAVLPFTNMSSDKENEYFSDGLAEEIINALTNLEGLRVTARTSAFAFRGKDNDIRKVGHTLNVAHVLEGSVRKSGNRVRITVQLSDVAGGYQLWSERYDREMTDVFAIQDEISQKIVQMLRVRLVGQSDPERPRGPLVKRYTENLDAYNLYLKGRYELNKMTKEGLDKSKQYFQEAIDLDPNYSLAYDGLAYSHYSEGFLGFAAPNQAMPKAKAAVRRALDLDETVAEAHATLGVILALYDWDWDGAERELMRSIELNGSSAVTRDVYAFYFLRPTGRLDDAIVETQHALSLDPLSVLFRVHLGFLFYLKRDYDRAIDQFRKAIEVNPSYYLAYGMMGPAYTQAGKFDDALAVYEKAKGLDASSRFVDSLVATTLAIAGRKAEARKLLAGVEELSRQGYISPVSIAYVYTGLGEKDKAFEYLDRAVRERDPNVLGLKSNPVFDSIRDDHRYSRLLSTMHLDG